MADAPRTASLTVLGGPLKGRSHIFEDAVEELFIGSDPDCQLCLDLPSVSPLHARLWLKVGGATVHDTHSPAGVFVNDDRVRDQAPLSDGDFLWLGTPGAEGSVLLQFRGPVRQTNGEVSTAAAGAAPSVPEEVWLIEEPAEALAGPGGMAAVPSVSAEPSDETPDEWFFEEITAAEAAAAPAVPALDVPSFATPEGGLEAQEFLLEEAAAPSPPAQAATPSVFDDLLLEEAPEEQPPAEEAVFEVPVEAESTPVEEPSAAPPAPPVHPTLEWDEEALAAMDEAPSPARPEGLASAESTPAPPLAAPLPPTPPRPSAPLPQSPAAARPTVPASLGTSRTRRPMPPPAPRQKAAGARPALLAMAVMALLAGGGLAAWWLLFSAPRIEAADPREARVGETVTLTGRNFASEPAGNLVRFKGEKNGRVIQASPTRLQVEVPEVETTPGQAQRVTVVVTAKGRASAPYALTLTSSPRIHGLSPSVAMPEEEITLAGAGWGTGLKVRFGTLEAQVVEVQPNVVRVRVPALTEPVGSQLSVVVIMGGVESNPAPFALGHLPLILAVEPPEAGPGDVVAIKGRGFHLRASANQLKIGGTPALVLQASDTELKAVVPRGAEGAQAPVELRVPASPNLGQTTLALRGLPDPLGFVFVTEPFSDGSAHEHAVLSTGLGPAFVLSASGGRSAGERALEAQKRLNEAAAALGTGATPDITVRLEGRPGVVLGGSGNPLLEVSDEDAAAYNEEWTESRGRGGPVTPARLALWWGALTRDLALALVRGERPKHASGLAPEGRALGELFDAVRKGSKTGLTREAMAKVKPLLREAARAAVLRVPPSVLPPVAPALPPPGAAQSTAPSAKPETLRLEGIWSGVEREAGEVRYVTVSFTRGGGNLTYERALSLTVPLLSADQQKGIVRYSLRSATHIRYYLGKWENQKIQGRICSDADCKTAVGSFELQRAR